MILPLGKFIRAKAKISRERLYKRSTSLRLKYAAANFRLGLGLRLKLAAAYFGRENVVKKLRRDPEPTQNGIAVASDSALTGILSRPPKRTKRKFSHKFFVAFIRVFRAYLRPQLHDTGFASERHQILLFQGDFGT